MGDLNGLRALVTGAGSGIGQECSALIAGSGGTVAGLDLKVDGVPDGCIRVEADVTENSSVDAAVASAIDQLGGLDIVLNCAGVGGKPGSVEILDLEEMALVMDVNVYGIVRVTRAALPALKQSQNAAIVNIASLAGIRGYRNRVAYGASKGAVVAMTMMMAADHTSDGIRINAVCPGSTETPWVEETLGAAPDPEAAKVAMEGMIPLRRLGHTKEIAAAICFIASPAASYFHGAIIPIDGGVSSLWVSHG